MSGRRSVGGLLGALRDRLRGRAAPDTAGRSPASEPARPEPSAAQRLDDALAGLRERIPEPGQQGPEPGEERSEPPGSSR